MLPQTFEDFQNSKDGMEGCVLSLFPSLTEMKTGNDDDFSNSNKVGTGFFTDTNNQETLQGCLVINWDKEETTAKDKGKGTFRFLWAVKEGNKGFVTFALGQDKKEGDKLSWQGVVYELGEEKSNWSIKRKLSTKTSPEYDESGIANAFPKAGKIIKGVKSKDFWDFLENANKLKNICDNNCGTNPTKSSLKGYGALEEVDANKTGDDIGNLDDGTSSLSTGGNNLFENDKGNMGEVVNGKKVQGKELAFFQEPKPETTNDQ